MAKHKIFLFVTFCLTTFLLPAQVKIKPGEHLVYTASYYMSGMQTDFAQITLKTNNVNTSDKTYLNLFLQAVTYSKWDSYFKIRDIYESYVDPNSLRPSLYKRSVFEGGYTKTEKYMFNKDGKTVHAYSKRKSDPEKNQYFHKGWNSTDIVSALYKLRTLDYQNKESGALYPISIVFDEKEINSTVKYLGKEKIHAGPLGYVDCYKITLYSQAKAMKGKAGNYIWITADSRRIPAYFKFHIPVGTGQLKLTSIK